MTVAAVVLAPDPSDARTVVGGVAAIRRIADIAWSGGALPIVVLAPGETAALELGGPLSGAPGTVIAAEPAESDRVTSAILEAGIRAARDEVEGTDAVLLWPGRHAYVDAETITSLIEAHGLDTTVALVPTYAGTPGWPFLFPLSATWVLSGMAGKTLTDLPGLLRDAGVPTREVELGDPGIVHDLGTAAADLPVFEGPPEPVAGAAPDWGERVPAVDPSPAPPRGAR